MTKRTNKLQSEELKSIFTSNDIVLLTETWTDNYSDTRVSGFETFELHREEVKNRSKRNSGGIIVYIREKYVNNEMLVSKSVVLGP